MFRGFLTSLLEMTSFLCWKSTKASDRNIERDIAKDPASYDALIERHEADQRVAGHWGVPLFVFKDEPFFGQDRMDLLRWAMTRAR